MSFAFRKGGGNPFGGKAQAAPEGGGSNNAAPNNPFGGGGAFAPAANAKAAPNNIFGGAQAAAANPYGGGGGGLPPHIVPPAPAFGGFAFPPPVAGMKPNVLFGAPAAPAAGKSFSFGAPQGGGFGGGQQTVLQRDGFNALHASTSANPHPPNPYPNPPNSSSENERGTITINISADASSYSGQNIVINIGQEKDDGGQASVPANRSGFGPTNVPLSGQGGFNFAGGAQQSFDSVFGGQTTQQRAGFVQSLGGAPGAGLAFPTSFPTSKQQGIFNVTPRFGGGSGSGREEEPEF